jgi:pyrimidine deaminase RibD-like protein
MPGAFSDAQKERWMRAAMAEGVRAVGGCAPNPPVGCVIVRGGEIVARGHTSPPGLPHAEAMALSHANGHGAELSVFVTLEPCSFFGRTPSCARALVERRVAQVFVGIIDPHPRNRGAGLELLRGAGIQVEVGVLGEEVWRALRDHLECAGG